MKKTFIFINTETKETEIVLADNTEDARNELCLKVYGMELMTDDTLEEWELQAAQG